MTWAARRRLIILSIIAVVLAAILGAVYYFAIRVPPSCFDNKLNQDEEEVDCGGQCTYQCTRSQAAPSVRFVRAVSPIPGRSDVIAYVDNPNSTVAAKTLHFKVELYNGANVVIGIKEGDLDLPPSTTVPVYIPQVYQGSEPVARAFLTFEPAERFWYTYKDTRIVPVITNVVFTPGDAPRITAAATNPSARALGQTTFIATIFDTEGNAIAASRTVAPNIAPQGTTNIVFTWPTPINGTVSRIEVIPVVPPPAP